MSTTLRLTVAGKTFELSADRPWPLSSSYGRFMSTETPLWRMEVYETHDSMGDGRTVGEFRGVGAIHQFGPTRYGVQFGDTRNAAFVGFDLGTGQVIYRADARHPAPRLLDFVLNQVARTFFIDRNKDALLVHAAGVLDGDVALAFVGHSGAGKSTLARLFKESGATAILNDDTIVLRRAEQGLQLSGTPWTRWGERMCAPLSAPLGALVFIEHGPQNLLAPVSASHAVGTLMQEARGNWCPTDRMATLDVIDDLLKQVPTRRLAFVPQSSAVDFLRVQLVRPMRAAA